MLTPTQVAKRANIHPNSVRNWSTRYAEFLSPSARGVEGPRLYMEDDVETMCVIAALTKSGMSSANIIDHLRERGDDIVVDLPTSETTPTLHNPPQTAQAGQDVALALHAVQSSLQAQIDALRADMRVQREDRVTWFLLGFALCVVVVAVVLWLR